MLFGILADLVLLLHLLWIGFLIFGALLFRRSKGGKVFHGLGLIVALGMQLLSLDCPLTLLEQWLRYRYSPRLTYEGSFITHWAAKIVYLDISPSLVTRLTLLLIGITISLYVWGWLRFQRNSRPS